MTRRRLLSLIVIALSIATPEWATLTGSPHQTVALQAQAPPTLQSSDLGGLRLRNIGPATMSGRFVDMDVVESNPFTMYVASATGGMFRTTDNGITWAAIFEREAVHSIGDVAIYQEDVSSF